MKGHNAGIVAIGERVPVFLGRIRCIGLVVLVIEVQAAGYADKAEVACLFPVDIVFHGSFHCGPAYGCAVALHPVGRVAAIGALPGG